MASTYNAMAQHPRLALVNNILETFPNNYRFSFRDKGLRFSWDDWQGKRIEKRWSCAPNFYPPFHRQMACGGTRTIAIAQLGRYCQGRSVLPLTTWQYWASPTVNLWPDPQKRERALNLLSSSCWPKKAICVFCGKDLSGKQWDWYHNPKQGVGCWAGCKTEKSTESSCDFGGAL